MRTIKTHEDFYNYIDDLTEYNRSLGNPPRTLLEPFISHDICPIDYIDNDTIELVNMVDLIGKINPDMYLDTSAVLINAIITVNSERAKIAKIEADNG